MKKSFTLKGFYTFSIAGAAVVIACAMTLLFTIGGVTAPAFTLGNLSLSIFLKALVCAVLIFVLTLVYYLISYKKSGLKISLFALLGGALSTVVAFSFCVICRAPLGHLTLAIMLSALVFSYISSSLFFRAFTERKEKRKKQQAAEELTPFEKASSKAFKIMLYVLVLTTFILVSVFITAMIFSNSVIMTCVLPAILSLISSVVITLAFSCRMFCDKK